MPLSFGLRTKALGCAALVGLGMMLLMYASLFSEHRSGMVDDSSVEMLELDQGSKHDLKLALELAVNRQKFEAQRALVQKYDQEVNTVYHELKTEVQKKQQDKDELLRLIKGGQGEEEDHHGIPLLRPGAWSPRSSASENGMISGKKVESFLQPSHGGEAEAKQAAIAEGSAANPGLETKPAAAAAGTSTGTAPQDQAGVSSQDQASTAAKGVADGISDLLRSVRDSSSFMKSLTTTGGSGPSPPASATATQEKGKSRGSLHEMQQFARVFRTLEERRVPSSPKFKLEDRGRIQNLSEEPAQKRIAGDEVAREEMESIIFTDDQSEKLADGGRMMGTSTADGDRMMGAPIILKDEHSESETLP